MNIEARRRNAQGYDEDEPLLEKTNRTPQKTSGWDIFDDRPREEESASMADQAFFERGEKLMKIVAYIVTFAIVLSSAVISKGTLLFMTSQVLNDTKAYCNEGEGRNKQFEVTIPQMERTAWIWSIIFAFLVPQLGIFVRSLRICVFKNWERPERWEFFVLFVTETLPSIGTALLVFCVLPELDVIKGAMLTNAVCFIPGVVGFISRSQKCPASSLRMTLDVVSIFAQASSFVVWPMVEGKKVLWLIPVSVLMISFGWWENYVSEESPVVFIRELAQSRKKFKNNRYYMYMFASVWKALVFFVSVLMIFWLREGSAEFLFDEFYESFGERQIFIREIEPIIYQENMPNISDALMTDTGKFIKNNYNAPVWVFLINIASTYVCYIFGKFACKILIQGFSYAFPVCLAMPVTLSALIAMTSAYTHDECKFTSVIPAYLFFDLPPVYNLKNFVGQEQSWIWLIWLLSQIWITVHIWSPTSERMARTEKLYVRPMYDPFLIDQDIALNRRREPDEQFDVEEESNNKDNELMKISETDSVAIAMDEKTKKDYTTRIFACGTMWHETKEEMMAFLKSIMRLDADQSARRLAREMLQYDADYYELETHVFFDDAFKCVRKNKVDQNPQINSYVKDLVESIREAASKVHGVDIDLYPPQKCSTPYGGRLVWTLPGRTKLIAHLKDKKKIRAKKRWSQVMYMYYLLGHRLAELKIPAFRRDLIADNTYILALDGDIDFQPKAVTLLVDLMKKNSSLGAACGRIHPIGSGPMVWYQKFEYAVGHWLQKATEHMIGCVLCSPGCFSLFRGRALMTDNVMKKYTTRSTEALHYVQYDQGEDRWLCTLMLQKGFRVEYSAASDAYTHCPEGFNEFYNQRRRWMPSTTANILDLLMDYKHTIQVNDNISRLYIAYQVVLMIGTVLGPGTIFLMLVGAFVAAFQLDQWSSFLWNIVPIFIFLFVCKVFEKDSIQLFFAGAISAVYGLIMMAVLVGVMLQISSDGFLAPSSLFFFCVAGEMIITAILHPKEIDCLLYGVVYYVTVPSMYMLLVIYSVFNMNNVSWGTREDTVVEQGDDKTKAPEPEKEKTLKEKMLDMLSKSKDDAGTFDFSVSGVFRCMLCTREANPVERYQLDEIKQSIAAINKKLDNIANGIQEEEPQRRKTAFLKGSNAAKQPNQEVETESSIVSSEDECEEDWLDDPVLEKGVTFNLPSEEKDFWNGLLEKYLHPIDDSIDKERIAKALIDLRDKSVAAFFMLNALFVLIVFLLTLKKDLLHVKWPFSVKTNFTYYDERDDQIELNKTYLQLEPIGLVFLVFFAILLVVQFIAMLFHRFATLCQILSNTTIDLALFKRSPDKVSGDENLKKNFIYVVKDMQKLKDDDDVAEVTAVRRKTTMADLEARQNQREKRQVRFLDDAYKERFEKLASDPSSGKGILRSRGTIAALQRRTTVAHARPSGLFQKNGGVDNPGFSMETAM